MENLGKISLCILCPSIPGSGGRNGEEIFNRDSDENSESESSRDSSSRNSFKFPNQYYPKKTEHVSKNTELFEIVCKYLGVSVSLPHTIDLDKGGMQTFCSKCAQLVSEILRLHQKIETIQNDISKKVEQIEQSVVALEPSKGKEKSISFIEEFRQKVKDKVQNRLKGIEDVHVEEQEGNGQGPPYRHIVEIQPSLMHQNLCQIKIQPEETDEEDDGSFSTEEIGIYPLNYDSAEDVGSNDQGEDESSDNLPTRSNFKRVLRPRLKYSKTESPKIEPGERVVKSEPESADEVEEADVFGVDIDPDLEEEEEEDVGSGSDVDDPNVSFSNESEEDDSDPEDEDWGSVSKKKSRREPIDSLVRTVSRRVKRRTRTKNQEGDVGKWDIKFTSDGRIFYENIEIHKTDTKLGFNLKCGECSREFTILRGKIRKRESPYYKMKVHIKGSHLGKYTCELCDKPMSCTKSLNRHIQRYHGTGIRSDVIKAHCEVCNKPFKTISKDFLFSHLWSHKSEDEKTAAINSGMKPPLTYAEKIEAKKSRKEQNFPCSQCDKTFLWRSLLKKHEIRVHVPEDQKIKNFACHVCGKLFVAQGDLTAHKRFVCEKEKLARLFFCSYCDKKFPMKEECAQHERKHTKEKPFQCTKCLKWYSQEKSLKRHDRDCKGREGSSGKFYQGVEMFHEEIETGFILRCGCCDFTVENIKAKQARCDTYRKIHLHIQGKHLGAFKCPICDKKLSDPKGLRNHLETHDNEAPKHRCEICGKPFKTNKNKKFLLSHLWSHMSEEERQARIVAGDTPPMTYAERMEMLKSKEDNLFQCDQCGKTFAWQCQLKKHERVHTDTKDRRTHQCTACGKFYATADSLNSHVKHVHDKDKVHKWHYCSFCDKKFSHKFAWRKHEKSHRRDTIKAFRCQRCSKAFSQEKNFQNHIRQCRSNQHGIDSSESTSSHPSGDQDQGAITTNVANISMPLGIPANSHAMAGNGLQMPQQFRQVPQSHSSTTPGHHFMLPGIPGSSRFYEDADGNVFQNFF